MGRRCSTGRGRDLNNWRFWIDRGGTFTDLVGMGPGGQLVVRKVLSKQSSDPGDPAVRAIREELCLPVQKGFVHQNREGGTLYRKEIGKSLKELKKSSRDDLPVKHWNFQSKIGFL